MIYELGGMRLKIESDKIVMGPLTVSGAVRESFHYINMPFSKTEPYPTDWPTWKTRIEQRFDLVIDGDYEIVTIKWLDFDQTLVVAEFKRIGQPLERDLNERVMW